MNFFAHQEQARRQTRRMLLLFALAVVGVAAATNLALFVVIQGASVTSVTVFSLVIVLVIGLGSFYRIATLRGGGAAVARQLGAVPVPPDTTNFAYRRLRNVIEELAIASGVPVPEIFVLEEEAGINAFAAGYATTDAAVTVTRGALDKLTRDELQGVIGHEFSHVLNGDMRLNIRLLGVVFGILLLATIGRKIAEYAGRGRGGRDAAGAVMFGLVLFAVGYIGVVFARLIKASISRQREFLADASAVQFTRQSDGIGGALKKIAALAEGSKLAGSDKEDVSHMLFADGVGFAALYATHPPLNERILRLDPSFSPDELVPLAVAWAQPVLAGAEAAGRADVSIAGFAPAVLASGRKPRKQGLPAADARVRLSPGAVVAQVGNPGEDDHEVARQLDLGIAPELRQAAGDPEQAMPLVFALLLNDAVDVREKQLAGIGAGFDPATRSCTELLAARLAGLHPMRRLPLAALAFPALRRRPRARLDTFMRLVRELIDADARVTLDEYCLASLLRTQVMDALDPARARVIGRTRLPEVAAQVADVLAILAEHGHEDEDSARRAFQLGMQEVLPAARMAYRPPTDWAQALDRALPRLDLLAPAGKELVVQALVRAIGADGVVSVREAELLRTVCAALHCPLPPMLQEG